MNDLEKFYRKNKIYFLPIGIIITSITILLAGLIPLWQNTVLVYEDVQVVDEQVRKLEKKLSVLNSLDEAELERQFAIATSALPIDKAPPTVITTVINLANATGITLETLLLDAPGALASGSAKPLSGEEQKIGAYTLPFSIGVKADITQLRAFLSKSNQIRRLVRAKSFNLVFSEEQEELRTQVYFDAFYSPLASKDSAEVLPELTSVDYAFIQKLQDFEDLANLPLSGELAVPATGASRDNPFERITQ